MNRTLTAITFATFALYSLAGCFGSPEGTVSRDDAVQATVIIWDTQTGEILVSALDQLAPTEGPDGTMGWTNQTIRQALAARGGVPDDLQPILASKAWITVDEATTAIHAAELYDRFAIGIQFTAGSGDSGLGPALERATYGAVAGDVLQGVLGDSGLRFGGQVTREASFGPVPLEGQLETGRFVGAFGDLPVGERFTPPGSFYEYEMVAKDDSFVTYRVLPEDGQRDAVPDIGSVLITYVDVEDESMMQVLDPIEGAIFTVDPPSPFNPDTPLDLEPGTYIVLPSQEGTLNAAFVGTPYPELIDRGLSYRITIQAVQDAHGAAAEPVDGNYGVRNSPQLEGAVSAQPWFGPWADRT